MRNIKTTVLAAVAGLAVAQTVSAYDLPSVNLGFTSFLDGAPPAGPGWYVQQYLQYYNNGQLKDADGDDIRLPTPGGGLAKANVDAAISLT